MEYADLIKIKGSVHIKVIGADGTVKLDKDLGKNLITTVGKAAIAGLVGNTGGITAFSYLAVGTSSTPVAITDTTLGAEIVDTGLARAVATVSRTTSGGALTNDTLNFVYTWTATGSKTIQEAGIFNAASNGTMLGHKLTGAIILTNTDQLVLTYTVQFT